MPIVLKRKLVKIGNSLRVTIPTEICDLHKLNPGDTLEFAASKGDIMIRKGKG